MAFAFEDEYLSQVLEYMIELRRLFLFPLVAPHM
jgi:hypothetical protein